MPLSQLDPVAALVVIDLQKGIAAMPAAQPAAEVIARAAQLARAFRSRSLPVALVNVAALAPGRTDTPRPNVSSFPADWAEIVPELDCQPSDILVTKLSWGAFVGTALDQALRRRGVTQIFFTGIATSIGVESSARSALDLGYNNVLVTDAMMDRDPEAHRWSVENIFPRLGEIASTDEVLARLTAGSGA